jgi:hypothetical protein
VPFSYVFYFIITSTNRLHDLIKKSLYSPDKSIRAFQAIWWRGHYGYDLNAPLEHIDHT